MSLEKYKAGDIFIMSDTFDNIFPVMLCQVDSGMYTLMCINTGNRWCDPRSAPTEMSFSFIKKTFSGSGEVRLCTFNEWNELVCKEEKIKIPIKKIRKKAHKAKFSLRG